MDHSDRVGSLEYLKTYGVKMISRDSASYRMVVDMTDGRRVHVDESDIMRFGQERAIIQAIMASDDLKEIRRLPIEAAPTLEGAPVWVSGTDWARGASPSPYADDPEWGAF